MTAAHLAYLERRVASLVEQAERITAYLMTAPQGSLAADLALDRLDGIRASLRRARAQLAASIH